VSTDVTQTIDTRRCGPCGKVYTMAEWLALPGAAGGSRMELSPGEWLEIRNCACGGTMAEPGRPDVRRIRARLAEIYTALVRLADVHASEGEKRASQEYAARVLRECRPQP
jgi:hypothetical protein